MKALKQFLGKDWRDITFEIYKGYLDALYIFTPSVYAYYFPGLLIITANVKTDGCFMKRKALEDSLWRDVWRKNN